MLRKEMIRMIDCVLATMMLSNQQKVMSYVLSQGCCRDS